MPDSFLANGEDRSDVLASTLATVQRVLDEMGCEGVSQDAVIAASPFYDGPVLVPQSRYGHFSGQMAYHLRFVGYPFDEVAFLTVRQFCEMYVRDTYPPVPSVPLGDEQYAAEQTRPSRGPAGPQKGFPICFIVGAPRSGTTLLRVMLNTHTSLWAPGELNLANYGSMEDRAHHVEPFLRYMPIPELAARCGQSTAAFSRTFRAWELAAEPISEVYQHLFTAEPGVLMVDKTSNYSSQLHVLEGIGARFPNAKFVHLLRSPHDMIRSYVRMHFQRGDRRRFESGRNPYQAGEAVWYTCNANAEAFLTSVPADRKCTVRYEELTAAPDVSLRAICELLEMDFEPAMADPYAQEGPTAQGAGDLYIHLKSTVEHRSPIAPFFELGSRCQGLVTRFGY